MTWLVRIHKPDLHLVGTEALFLLYLCMLKLEIASYELWHYNETKQTGEGGP